MACKEFNLVSVATNSQHGEHPTSEPGAAAVPGLCLLLMPGTVHTRLEDELFLLKLPFCDGLIRYDEVLVLWLISYLKH